jgi:hypothetical protein
MVVAYVHLYSGSYVHLYGIAEFVPFSWLMKIDLFFKKKKKKKKIVFPLPSPFPPLGIKKK